MGTETGMYTHHAQKDELRSVCVTSRPTTLLNHWRSSCTSDTSAMGTLKMVEHSLVMLSKRVSAGCSSRSTRQGLGQCCLLIRPQLYLMRATGC